MLRIIAAIRSWVSGDTANAATPFNGEECSSVISNVAMQERLDWMNARGFRYVLDPFRPGYVEGFDRNQEYEFMRENWDGPAVFRMSDQDELFNVWGLRYRPLDTSPRP